jgi:hypothetical protein
MHGGRRPKSNPLIYAGEGVIYAGASEDLKALVELVNGAQALRKEVSRPNVRCRTDGR